MNTNKKPWQLSPFLGCPLFLVMIVFSVPWLFVALIYLWLREKKLLRKLKANHRVLSWEEVEAHLNAGEGSLIVEQAQKQGVRLWWTPDDVVVCTPVPIPNADDLDYIRTNSPQPFITWCFDRYLSVQGGTAFLTRPKNLKFPPGFVETAFLHDQYPKAKVVQTVLISRKSK